MLIIHDQSMDVWTHIGLPIALASHSVILYGISLGLFVDELTYPIIRGKNHEDNYSAVSIVGTLLFIGIVFILKGWLILFI